MSDIDKIIKIISEKKETSTVDFKRDFYKSIKNSDLPKDIIAFANLRTLEDKYIVFGVDDKTRKVVGIDISALPTQDDVDNYISRVIEPFVNIILNAFVYEDKCVAYIKIPCSNSKPPYMIKETCGKDNKIEKGDIYIRKGTCNQKVSRFDLDNIYINNGKLTIKAFENIIVIEPINMKDMIPPNPTYGHISIEINNDTTRPCLITNGIIEICNEKHKVQRSVFSILPQMNIREQPIQILPKSRDIYTILFDFSSQDCVDFHFNLDGFVHEAVVVKIILKDTDDKEYMAAPIRVLLFAKGDILHKVKLKEYYSKKEKL